MSLRYCAMPGCSVLVQKGYCPAHARAVDQGTRGTAHQRGYSYRWSVYSKARLGRLPVCGMREDGTLDAQHSRCVQRGLTTAAQCTDHIVPLSQGGSLWDPNNHLSLCNACNAWKMSTIERRKSAR